MTDNGTEQVICAFDARVSWRGRVYSAYEVVMLHRSDVPKANGGRMKREHLIIIAVVIFVLVACGFGVLGAVVLWPNDPEPPDGPIVTHPKLPPVVQNPQMPSYAQPRVVGQAPTPSRSQDPIDYLPGVWQCEQAGTQFKYKSALQFAQSSDGSSGLAYFTEDPYSDDEWVAYNYQLGVEGSMSMWATSAPQGQTPVTYRFWLQWPQPDMQTMLIYSGEPGDEATTPAVMIRVQ